MFNLFAKPSTQSAVEAPDFCFKWATGEISDTEFMLQVRGDSYWDWMHSVDREYLDREKEYSQWGETFDELLS